MPCKAFLALTLFICPALSLVPTQVFLGGAFAATLIVDASGGGEYLNIQEAVDAASPADTVLVMPGHYEETISIVGKDIHLISSNGPASTVIDAGGAGSVIHCVSLSTNSSIQGFTITGGVAPLVGGGIYLVSLASPLVKGNLITGNRAKALGVSWGSGTAERLPSDSEGDGMGLPLGRAPMYCEPIPGSGGGIYVHFQCLPMIVDNVIRDNEASRDGGGVVFWDHADATLERNVVIHNIAGRNGGGVFVGCNARPTLERNLIAWNGALAGGGVHIKDFEADAVVRRNTLFENRASGGAGGIQCEGPCAPEIAGNLIGKSAGPGILCDESATPHIACNNVWDSDGENFDGGCFASGLTYRDFDNDVKDVEFCAPWILDFRPCLHPLFSTCGAVGAEDDTCGPGECGVSKTSWGRIKALFRNP